jgi:HPr kinase/phosphorylase
MPQKQKVKKITSISVSEFLEGHGDELGLSLISNEEGLERPIHEPTINRPGLALAGFFTYFAEKRIQVFGHSEISYLRKLTERMRAARFRRLCEQNIPCLVLARGHKLTKELAEVAKEQELPVIGTKMVTMNFVNAATFNLEHDFAPSTNLHGCMVDIRGVGVLITGKSGSGKSETAIGLLERGAALVADDIVQVRLVGGELIARAPELSRGYLEMRGIGIINAANLFGLASIRPEKRLDLVVTLKPHADLNSVDRLGLQEKKYKVLDQGVAHVEIPIAPGRDTARMVAVAALDHQLRKLGYNMADEFNQRLLAKMAEQKRGPLG